ncbi:hypothetical protein [Alkaliphilus sp. B6464]|uniref:hypothetical protein n=1 Tax=Alkaliphilus sp. B6464 TaxID=2731219 RepID=UPI001BADEF4A|nr:hypothetical protein [Alkaliphilus sp. B6464]QUH20233.1 hypothetical protein HYG84_10150 [Alkaliphilus sp. B6464]
MEKIKDFFHDFSDVFFAIVVASVMFVVLSWNLGSWFSNSSNTVLADEPVNITKDKNNNPISENDDKQSNIVGNEEVEKNNSDKDKVTPEDTTDNIESEETDVPSDNIITSEQKTVSIPNGTPGSGIAKILKENGLIDDAKDFIQAAENLNLAHRLKSGSFEIPTNATIEDMVKIIAGQKK